MRGAGEFRGWRTTALIILPFLIIVSLSSCGGGETAGDTPASSPVSMATPLSGLPILGAPVWTRSIDLQTAEPLQPVQVFADSDRVLGVSFPIVQIPAGTEIQAAWEYNDTSLDGLDVSLAVEIDRVEGWVAFRLERDDGGLWPDGRYMILLETDGVAITSGEIEVVEES